MAINRSLIQSAEINEVTDVAIQIVSTRPSPDYIDYQAGTPNTLVGYYDASTDSVELYIRDSTGYRLIKLI